MHRASCQDVNSVPPGPQGRPGSHMISCIVLRQLVENSQCNTVVICSRQAEAIGMVYLKGSSTSKWSNVNCRSCFLFRQAMPLKPLRIAMQLQKAPAPGLLSALRASLRGVSYHVSGNFGNIIIERRFTIPIPTATVRMIGNICPE